MKYITLVISVFALLIIFLSFILMDFNDLIVIATSEIHSNSTQTLNQVLVQPELTTSETIAQTDNLQNPSIQDSYNQQQHQAPSPIQQINNKLK